MTTPAQGDGAPGADRPQNPFAPPTVRAAQGPAPSPFDDYGPAPAAGNGPSPYDTEDPAALRRRPEPGPESGPIVFPGTDDVDTDVVLGGSGYTSRPAGNEPLAVAAMVLGLFAVVPGVGVAAVVCGHLGLRRLERSYLGGRGLAVAGLVLGYALTALWALLFLGVWALRDL